MNKEITKVLGPQIMVRERDILRTFSMKPCLKLRTNLSWKSGKN